MSALALAALTAARRRASWYAEAMPGLASPAVQAAARLLSRTWVAPITAMRWPLTVTRWAR